MSKALAEYQKTLSARVPDWVHKTISEDCKNKGIKVSDYLRELLSKEANKIKEV